MKIKIVNIKCFTHSVHIIESIHILQLLGFVIKHMWCVAQFGTF